MLGFNVHVEKNEKTADLEIQGFPDQESADQFAGVVSEVLLMSKDENEEFTAFEVEQPAPMVSREGVPEADIEYFIDQISMSVMSPEPENLLKGESPLRLAVELPITY